jgi:AraC family transcriptional regulator
LLYGVWGDKFLAKIAAELEQLLAQRDAHGTPGHITARTLAVGDGWGAADLVCTSGPQDRPFEERHDKVSIAVVVAGTFQYRGGSKQSQAAKYELMTPGSLLLGNPGESFECGHAHARGDRCISFHYSPDHFERLAADDGVARGSRTFPILRLPPLRVLSPLVAQVCTELSRCTSANSRAAWEELSVLLAGQAIQLATGFSSKRDAAPTGAVGRVTSIVRAIEQHPDMRLTLSTLAREAKLSPYHLLRTFEQLTGVTPHQYILRARLRKAAVRVAEEPAKILDIALDCGFGDVSNFNRAFRAEFGLSPRAFRRRARN